MGRLQAAGDNPTASAAWPGNGQGTPFPGAPDVGDELCGLPDHLATTLSRRQVLLPMSVDFLSSV